jgi:hypothetical protein
MTNRVYTINKGINRPIEFRGLRGQYIGYLAVGLLLHLLGFALLYLTGMNPYFCVVVIGCTGTVMTTRIYALNKKYGAFGLMKRQARRKIPQVITCRSRRPFTGKDPGKISLLQTPDHDKAT